MSPATHSWSWVDSGARDASQSSNQRLRLVASAEITGWILGCSEYPDLRLFEILAGAFVLEIVSIQRGFAHCIILVTLRGLCEVR